MSYPYSSLNSITHLSNGKKHLLKEPFVSISDIKSHCFIAMSHYIHRNDGNEVGMLAVNQLKTKVGVRKP